MAQYPQGIYQSLQWLLKKVKILALNKQPVYNVGTIANGTTYTVQGRGLYVGTSAGTGQIALPNPALYQGQTITIAVPTGFMNISPTYAPIVNGSPLTSIASTNVFVSDGVIWYGGGLF